MKMFKVLFVAGAAIISSVLVATPLLAADTEFTQSITAGTLTTEILDSSQQTVATPSVAMSTVATSATCQVNGSTGTLGTNSERIYVDNPGAALNGWTLSIAATGGPSAVWQGAGNSYSFNSASDGGCDDGQFSINPSSATLSLDCAGTCTNTGVAMGSANSFNSGVVDAITLVNASSASDDIWRGYLTGIGASQTIPAGQAPDTYSIDMTLTAVAL